MVQLIIDGEVCSEHEVEGSDPRDAIEVLLFVHDPFQTEELWNHAETSFFLN